MDVKPSTVALPGYTCIFFTMSMYNVETSKINSDPYLNFYLYFYVSKPITFIEGMYFKVSLLKVWSRAQQWHPPLGVKMQNARPTPDLLTEALVNQVSR